MSDIFISYARDDRPRVQLLADALEAQDWTVWWDPVIPTGKKFDKIIEHALLTARCVIVIWSSASIESDWVLTEADEGRRRQVLIPVRIDEVQVPLGFRRLQTADLIGWDGTESSSAIQALLADLKSLLGRTPPGHEPGRAIPSRIGRFYESPLIRAMGVSAAVGLVVVLAVWWWISDHQPVLLHERFRIESSWGKRKEARSGHAISLTDKFAAVVGPNESDFNAVVKMVDGRRINGRFWTFISILPAKLEGKLIIIDEEGRTRNVFPISARTEDTSKDVEFSADPEGQGEGKPCEPDAETLCLLQNRFRISMRFEDLVSESWRTGIALPYSQTSGFFGRSVDTSYDWAVRALEGMEKNEYRFQVATCSDDAWTMNFLDVASGIERKVENKRGALRGGLFDF